METKRIYLYIKNNKHEFTKKLHDKPKDKTRLVFISDTHDKFIQDIFYTREENI